ncbi:MAG: redox-regulated ATPase YchF [Patescibacteria group bacterium]
MKSIGIVGLPNVGKSTLFNVITKLAVPAENFPFCTIDKNVGIVEYRDERILNLAKLFQSNEIFPAVIQFVDIAGLVKGASKGEGLGNQFLSHIREVDLVMYLLRAFPDKQVTHVYDRIDPKKDFEDVLTELILKDVETVEKKIVAMGKDVRSGKDDKIKVQHEALQKLLKQLLEGKTAYRFKNDPENKSNEAIRQIIHDIFLLTSKPFLVVLNISYIDMSELAYVEKVAQWKKDVIEFADFAFGPGVVGDVAFIDSKFLADIQSFSAEELDEMKKDLSYFCDVQTLIEIAKKKLHFINFYVGNEKDTRSWFLTEGDTAVDAAACIHTSIAEKFVRAQITNAEDILSLGGFNEVKAAGKLQTVGKTYVMQDGDYINVLTS